MHVTMEACRQEHRNGSIGEWAYSMRCPLVIAHRPLPFSHCPSAVARRPLPVGRCLSAVARRPLPIGRCPSAITRRLDVARRPLPVGHRRSPLLVGRCPSPLTVAIYPSPLSFVKRNFLWRWDSEAIFFWLSCVKFFSWLKFPSLFTVVLPVIFCDGLSIFLLINFQNHFWIQ